MDRRIASQYISDNFEPTDRLAIVLLDKRKNGVTQRIASAAQISTSEFQAWLRQKNAQKCEVYISMNALRTGASGRTKGDIGTVRHVYLDFDENGTAAVERLMRRSDLPRPNYRLNSSPEKWQIVWKVEGFTPDQAERLQRALARDAGADPAATDCARVLRLPGFYNHKYEVPHFITVTTLSRITYSASEFPTTLPEPARQLVRPKATGHHNGNLSQSERDWAFAKRALARGEPRYMVIAAIAAERQLSKHNPNYYAERTVSRAAESLSQEEAFRRATPSPER